MEIIERVSDLVGFVRLHFVEKQEKQKKAQQKNENLLIRDRIWLRPVFHGLQKPLEKRVTVDAKCDNCFFFFCLFPFGIPGQFAARLC